MEWSAAALEWGLGLILWLQALPSWVTPAMRVLSRLGDAETLVVLVPVVLWCVDSRLGLRAGALLLTYGACNTTVKNVFALPRPYWVSDAVQALSTEASFGMPSGHAGLATATLGRLAVAARAGARVALVLMILGISVSRVHLGVHWPADVVGGWALGGALLTGFLLGERRLGPRIAGWSVGRQVAGAAGLSLGLLLLAVAAVDVRDAGGIDQAWVRTAAAAAPAAQLAPFSLESSLTSSGALFGLLAGWALLHRDGGLDAGGPPASRLARYLTGLVGVWVLFFALGVVVPAPTSVAGAALTWAQLAATGWWIAHGAPSLFVRLGLAERESDPAADH